MVLMSLLIFLPVLNGFHAVIALRVAFEPLGATEL